MMKAVLLFFGLTAATLATGQSYTHVEESSSNPFLSDVNGRPLYTNTNYIAEGSPFFTDEYYPARLTGLNGKTYQVVKVKVNILERIVQYLSDDGKEMATTVAIRQIQFSSFSPSTDKNVILQSFETAINEPGASVYQVLDTGRIKLLKKITIASHDEKKYNDASTTRIFERKEVFYYRRPDGQIKKLEKGKHAMLELFSDQRAKLEHFIDEHHLACKSVSDYCQIFSYYHSLSGT